MMLTDGIAEAFRSGRDRMAQATGVRSVMTTPCHDRTASPNLFEVSGADWLSDHSLADEVFGPLGLIVRVRHASEMQTIARSLPGQLTCTLHLEEADMELAQMLTPVLERKAGRLLANGFPTGVEVVDAQVHGGPYPASTNFGATSVGTLSIRRWLRPVAYQNMPTTLLPQDWAD
jgi:NADP-dependent aldehyde dehydrogenase